MIELFSDKDDAGHSPVPPALTGFNKKIIISSNFEEFLRTRYYLDH